MPLNATQLLALGAARRVTITLDGGDVLVRELSVADRAQVMALAANEPAKVPALVMRLCCINEDGSAIFSENDAQAISAMRTDIVDAIARAAMRVGGMTAGGDEKKD